MASTPQCLSSLLRPRPCWLSPAWPISVLLVPRALAISFRAACRGLLDLLPDPELSLICSQGLHQRWPRRPAGFALSACFQPQAQLPFPFPGRIECDTRCSIAPSSPLVQSDFQGREVPQSLSRKPVRKLPPFSR